MDDKQCHETAIETVGKAIEQVKEISRCECCDRALVKLKEALFWLREQMDAGETETPSEALASPASAVPSIFQAIAPKDTEE